MAYRWALGALARLARAGIEPFEAMQVLAYGRRWPRRAHSPIGVVLTVWGRTKTGRPLLVLLRPQAGTLDARIVSARDLTAAEEDELARWEATR